MPQGKSIKTDWLRIEDRIRNHLQDYTRELVSAEDTVRKIDSVLGEETGRGWELPDPNAPKQENPGNIPTELITIYPA